jgi:hypothetical protein
VDKHPCILSGHSGTVREQAAVIKEAFDWTLQTMALLRQLDGVLLSTVNAWESFNSHGGDIGYFNDTNTSAITPRARLSLHAITATFRQLQENREKIVLLNKCCFDFSIAVSQNPFPFAYGRLVTRE